MLIPQLLEKLVVIILTMEKLAITMSEDTGGASMTFIRWQLPQHWVWFYIGEGGRFAANRLVDSGAVWAASEG
jgi:hypothetical protein